MTTRRKIILANLAVFGVLLTVFAYMVYRLTMGAELAIVDAQLESCAAQVATEFEDEWEEETEPEWDDILNIEADGLSAVLMSMRNENSILFQSESFPEWEGFNEPSLPLVYAVVAEPVRQVTYIRSQPWRTLSTPLSDDHGNTFCLTVLTPISDVADRLNRLLLLLILLVIGGLSLASLAVHWATRLAFRPLAAMVGTAEKISGEDLAQRVPVGRHSDEVSRLATALNGMMERIEQAFRSQRQFVTDASHELRTPLTVVIGELEFLKKRLQEAELQRGLDTALDELDRLTLLVDQLLVLARIDTERLMLEIESIRLDELLLDCIRVVRKQAERRSIVIKPEPIEQIESCGDALKLRSVFLNLIDNAVKYSPDGGVVVVSVAMTGAREAKISVSDRGPGIDRDELPKVFDRFYRAAGARSQENGSGLGLAIAREIAELHGGRIEVASKVGSGTTFMVTLPLPTG